MKGVFIVTALVIFAPCFVPHAQELQQGIEVSLTSSFIFIFIVLICMTTFV